MLGVLKLNNYRTFTEAIESVSGENISVLIESPKRNYITSLILYGKEIVDYTTTVEAVEGSVRLTFSIPAKYDINKVSVYSFSHEDGYTNRLIGSKYWGVWFKFIGTIVSVGEAITLPGASLLVVPWETIDLKLKFTRLNNSSAGHGELT